VVCWQKRVLEACRGQGAKRQEIITEQALSQEGQVHPYTKISSAEDFVLVQAQLGDYPRLAYTSCLTPLRLPSASTLHRVFSQCFPMSAIVQRARHVPYVNLYTRAVSCKIPGKRSVIFPTDLILLTRLICSPKLQPASRLIRDPAAASSRPMASRLSSWRSRLAPWSQSDCYLVAFLEWERPL